MGIASYHSRVLIPLFENQSAAGVDGEIDISALADNVGVYIVWNGNVTAGQVTIETAHRVGYSGSWHTLTTVAPGADKVSYYNVEASIAVLRVRISAALTGGAVSAYVIAR